jgi:hypothetical protein
MTVRCWGVFQITTLQLKLNDHSNGGMDYVFDTYHAWSRADDRFWHEWSAQGLFSSKLPKLVNNYEIFLEVSRWKRRCNI